MTNNVPYISSTVMDKILKIAAKKYPVNYEDVGLVMMQSEKITYSKKGIQLASDDITFILFNNNMEKIGIVKRDEIKKYARKLAAKKEKNSNPEKEKAHA